MNMNHKSVLRKGIVKGARSVTGAASLSSAYNQVGNDDEKNNRNMSQIFATQ
jgi:hypothetical protein